MRVLAEALCSSAEHFLAEAIELELDHFLLRFAQQRSPEGLQAVVRNGYQPQRRLLTGIGPVSVRIPKIRSRAGRSLAFHSMLVPAYLRRARLREFTPALTVQYLNGITDRNFGEALAALVGLHSMHLPQALGREIHALWSGLWEGRFSRPLDGESWQELRVDSIPVNSGDDGKNACVMVAIGVSGDQGSQLLATRECSGNVGECWGTVLLDLKSRGANLPSEVSIGRATGDFARVCDAVLPGNGVSAAVQEMAAGGIAPGANPMISAVCRPRCAKCSGAAPGSSADDDADSLHRSGRECA